MQGDQLRVNGTAMSWGSITVKIDTEEVFGWTKIEYGDGRTHEKGWQLGRHQAPTRRSNGEYDTENVKLTGYKASVAALQRHLAQANGTTSYGGYEFEILVQAVEEDETDLNVEIRRCTYEKSMASHERGPSLLTEDVEINCMSIVRNGLTLFDTSLGEP